jgi:divinyl protochlorophyllide a 8-vinyl-reductase
MTAARIGPNAILQAVAVLDRAMGQAVRERVMARAAVPMPSGAEMIPETDAAAMHLALRREVPGQADDLLWQAGQATGDYILRHRIPALAQRVIRLLPSPIAARVLSGAIAKHAWTFAGSGAFSVQPGRPLVFLIRDNPLRDPDGHPCLWHAAVFQHLFRALVWPKAVVQEVECQAQGAPLCRFELRPHP